MHKVGIFIIALSIAASFIVSPSSVSAKDFSLIQKGNGIVSDACIECGACTVCDFISVLSKGMRFMLGVSGALALAFFIWGAWQLTISAGNAEQVETGKKILIGTTIGLTIIMLLAWAWPGWVIVGLRGAPAEGKPLTIFGSDGWWLTPCQTQNKPVQQCIGEPESRPPSGAVGPCVKLVDNVVQTTPAGGECTDKEGKTIPGYV